MPHLSFLECLQLIHSGFHMVPPASLIASYKNTERTKATEKIRVLSKGYNPDEK